MFDIGLHLCLILREDDLRVFYEYFTSIFEYFTSIDEYFTSILRVFYEYCGPKIDVGADSYNRVLGVKL